MVEVWKDIRGYENLYQVSNLGHIKSLAKKTNNQFGKTDRILKGSLSKTKGCEYYHVTLCNGKTQKQLRMERCESLIIN